MEKKKNREGKGKIYLEKENIWSTEEKEDNIWRRKMFGPQRKRRREKEKRNDMWRRKIFGSQMRRKNREGKGGKYLEKEQEKNSLPTED